MDQSKWSWVQVGARTGALDAPQWWLHALLKECNPERNNALNASKYKQTVTCYVGHIRPTPRERTVYRQNKCLRKKLHHDKCWRFCAGGWRCLRSQGVQSWNINNPESTSVPLTRGLSTDLCTQCTKGNSVTLKPFAESIEIKEHFKWKSETLKLRRSWKMIRSVILFIWEEIGEGGGEGKTVTSTAVVGASRRLAACNTMLTGSKRSALLQMIT